MSRHWRYLIPSILTVIYILVSTYTHYYYFYAILLLANCLNIYWGEFEKDELPDELRFFYKSSEASGIKCINAIILLCLFVWGVRFVDGAHLTTFHLIGFSVTTGILTGCFVVTLAHDMLHSSSLLHRGLSVLLLIGLGIPHFATEHLCGHHRDIGLKEDPTTARLNQDFYSYFLKIPYSTVRSCYFTQFGLPSYLRRKIRLTNLGMLGLLFIVWGCLVAFTRHPGEVITFFILQGFVSYFLYELINYIQHYGLFRKAREDQMTLRLSWNCYFKYTNYILFLLHLHSLHHLPGNARKIKDFKAGPECRIFIF